VPGRVLSAGRAVRGPPSILSVGKVSTPSSREKRPLNDFTEQIIKEFRANDGQVGGPFTDARLLLLTTTGARSGRPHTTVLGYYPDGERVLVVGSAGGGPKHPDWYHNLVADPAVTVETGPSRTGTPGTSATAYRQLTPSSTARRWAAPTATEL
jgi:deazaflavin-dependent oxidoreductase (nitroreductase family)